MRQVDEQAMTRSLKQPRMHLIADPLQTNSVRRVLHLLRVENVESGDSLQTTLTALSADDRFPLRECMLYMPLRRTDDELCRRELLNALFEIRHRHKWRGTALFGVSQANCAWLKKHDVFERYPRQHAALNCSRFLWELPKALRDAGYFSEAGLLPVLSLLEPSAEIAELAALRSELARKWATPAISRQLCRRFCDRVLKLDQNWHTILGHDLLSPLAGLQKSLRANRSVFDARNAAAAIDAVLDFLAEMGVCGKQNTSL